jgi:hypothetical protein
MRLQCLVQDGDITFSDESRSVTVERSRLHPAER